MNKAQIIGRLGNDAEIRVMGNSKRVANVSIATEERWKSNGERKSRTTWHRVVVFGDSNVNFIEQYVGKGDMVMVEGIMKHGEYENRDGVKIPTFEIAVSGPQHTFQLLASKKDNGAGERANSAAGQRETFSADLDEEIPF